MTTSKCTVQWHYAHSHRAATIATTNLQNSVIIANSQVKANQSRTLINGVKADFIQDFATGEKRGQYRTGVNSKYSVDKWGLLAKEPDWGGWKITKRVG